LYDGKGFAFRWSI